MIVAGIMSGTSLDGIDAAIVDVRGVKLDVIAHRTTPYPKAVRQKILAVSNAQVHTGNIARLNFELAELYANAVAKCGVPLTNIKLVGSHGQTIYHDRVCTLQIGDGSVLAERLGIPVVSDFRPRDMAAGGRGAPLVPFVDYRLFRHAKRARIALNIGGIANITVIPAGARPDQVIAFDTGPGNMVIDALAAIMTKGRHSFDRGGALAAGGNVDKKLLNRLLAAPFYRTNPPKTAGREQYGSDFVEGLLKSGLSPADLMATVTVLTPASIAAGIRRFSPFEPNELIVSGGGTHNPLLMAYLQAFLPKVTIINSSSFGVDSDAKEAIAFAILAYETWHRRPSNMPSATGARHPVILGKVSY